MANEELVLWRVDDGVGHIVLNRPEAANALNADSSRALCAAIEHAATADIGAVLVSSRGKQFCAGGDVQEFVNRQGDLDRFIEDLLDTMHPAIHTLATLSVPVVSAIQGPVGGAGISLALCADVVLASPTMKLRGGYSAIALCPDLGASYYLSRRAGGARAKALLMTNRAITADECLRWGLVDEIHDADELPRAANELAMLLARGATGSLGYIKRLCDDAFAHDLGSHLRREREALLHCAESNDAGEGVRAFVEKRAPQFTDKRIA